MQTSKMDVIMSKVTKEDLTVELASVLIVMARQIQLWSHRTDLPAEFLGLDEDWSLGAATNEALARRRVEVALR